MPLCHLGRTVRRRVLNKLYHEWSWAYDLVARGVSAGHWFDWVRAVEPLVVGPRVLEIGPGTGHLIQSMASNGGLEVMGLDESSSMLQLSRARTSGRVALIRGLAQALPLVAACVDTIVATFPSDFVADVGVLRGFSRVLRPHGQLVVLPVAQLAGRRPSHRLADWLLSSVGGVHGDAGEALRRHLLGQMQEAGFEPVLVERRAGDSVVLLVVATAEAPIA